MYRAKEKIHSGNKVNCLLTVGVVCNLIISVDVHPHFTGIAPNIISSTNTTQNFTIE